MGAISVQCEGGVCAVYEGSVLLMDSLEPPEARQLAVLFEAGIRMADGLPKPAKAAEARRAVTSPRARPARGSSTGGKTGRRTNSLRRTAV
jgi:hypothetical protein